MSTQLLLDVAQIWLHSSFYLGKFCGSGSHDIEDSALQLKVARLDIIAGRFHTTALRLDNNRVALHQPRDGCVHRALPLASKQCDSIRVKLRKLVRDRFTWPAEVAADPKCCDKNTGCK